MDARAIDDLAGQVLAHAGQQQPPVNVERLASALGVTSIKQVSMVEDGRLEQRYGSASIFIRAEAPRTRQRFTVAHELGHLMLAGPHKDFVARRMWPRADREERFCDQFAAALLLPREWVIENFRDREKGLQAARDLAEATQTSLAASVVRLRELLGWQASFLHWRRYEKGFRLATSAGVPTALHNRVTSAPGTNRALEALERTGRPQRMWLPLAIDRAPQQVPAEVCQRGQGVIALANLDGLTGRQT